MVLCRIERQGLDDGFQDPFCRGKGPGVTNETCVLAYAQEDTPSIELAGFAPGIEDKANLAGFHGGKVKVGEVRFNGLPS